MKFSEMADGARRELCLKAIERMRSDPYPSWSGSCKLVGCRPGDFRRLLEGDEELMSEWLKARGENEAHWVSLGSNNYRAQVFSIFALKTIHGETYRESQAVDHKPWSYECEVGDKGDGKADTREGKL